MITNKALITELMQLCNAIPNQANWIELAMNEDLTLAKAKAIAMSSTDSEVGGHDLKFLEEPPDALKCLFCLLVARDPQQHGECGRLFCNSCANEYKERGSTTCPYCNLAFNTFTDGKSALEIKSLRIGCEIESCPWEGELRDLESHLDSCDYKIVDCPNDCECSEVTRKDLENHLKEVCLRRNHKCPLCLEDGEYQLITSSHIEECPEVVIECPNDRCEERLPRKRMEDHMDECDYQMVACKYARIGCDTERARRDLTEHEGDFKLHLELTTEIVLEQKKEIAYLKYSQESTVIKITKFQEKKEEFSSTPFYSSKFGYRMYLSSKMKTAQEGFISLFANILKGPYDDMLKWPFEGTVLIKLLNQLEDKNHYEIEICFSGAHLKYEDVGARVIGDKRSTGLGRPSAILLTELEFDSSKNCQYLKDDMLVFRVSVETPDYKPWLN